MPAVATDILEQRGLLIGGHREQHSKAHMVAFSGGAEDLQNPLGSWNVIARVWPSSMQSLGPVFLSIGIGSSSLSQLAVLLIIPTVLTCGAPEHVSLAGWSLGCGIAQFLAALLATCLGSVSSISMFEARTRKPFVFPLRLAMAVWVEGMQAPLEDGQSVFIRRRDSLWLTQCIPLVVTFARSFEIQSGLLRTDSQMFEKDEAVVEKNDIYTMAGSPLHYPESDHYVLAVHNAWDIARRIRADGCLVHPSPSQSRHLLERSREVGRHACTARTT